MEKKQNMKRSYPTLFFFCLLAGCSHPSPPSIVGTRTGTGYNGGPGGQLVTFTETFQPDGTGTYTQQSDTVSLAGEFRYTVDGTHAEEKSADASSGGTSALRISGNTLIMIGGDGTDGTLLHRQH